MTKLTLPISLYKLIINTMEHRSYSSGYSGLSYITCDGEFQISPKPDIFFFNEKPFEATYSYKFNQLIDRLELDLFKYDSRVDNLIRFSKDLFNDIDNEISGLYQDKVIDTVQSNCYTFKEDEVISSIETGDEQWILIKKKSQDKLPKNCLKKQNEKQSKRKKKESEQREITYFPTGS